MDLVRERDSPDAHVIDVDLVSFLIWSSLSRTAKSEVPNARMPIFDVPSFTDDRRRHRLRAFSNLRDSRSMMAWYSSGFSV